ncbi:endo-1,4-beta-xylanase [Roseburia faecis]|uniref:Beta-xylanase n=1 Tax=Roseburia faecis TaxID=301302 RepID=A0A173TWN8_9FIRM|nr:endo-1,4-beta-xylanase [Roseburia faecis]CUN06914.1 Endo-1%2C4-beta-xylanase A precursor [Roseburia faecis]
MWKMGACIALSAAMTLTSTGGMLPSDWGIETVYADETQTTAKTFTAEQLEVIWGNAEHKLEDGQWKLSFANQYDQVKWKVPEVIALSDVKSVMFHVADQKGSVTLKVYNGGDDAEAANTQYGLTGSEEYTIEPSGEGSVDAVGLMTTDETGSGSEVSLISVTFELKEGSGSPITYGDNIIKDGDFASNEAAASWNASVGNSKITVEEEENEIGDSGLKTYGVINRDPATATSGDCFSQDITDAVELGEEYQYSFWAKLSDVYKDAPEEQRNVDFAPFYVSGGEATYLGSYSTGVLSGEITKTLTAGEWTKFSGTFNVPKTADQIVIRIIEQGTNYGQGDCVKGAYCVTGVSMKKITRPKPEIEKNIPEWKTSVTESLGNDSIAGTAIMLSEISDDTLMELVEKHFNAVTFGNELKPDALFNYQIDGNSVPTKTITFEGEELQVPIVNDAGDSLDFSRADAMADKILAWNNAHPDQKIRIRGHVLVWHSQTQEWFFHENYDITKPYVNKETMNRRLEWFISGVFDHYFGKAANGKYDGLFYGWDVVNEAVIGNTYRTDKVSAAESLSEIRHGNNSSWWHVYESNEFIINAFKYANKYAPANVELYYNDFGETDNTKCEGIVKLINDVKSAEGTRLDAFGMQAHYNVDGFSAAQFKSVAKKYAQAAGKVQLTELDFKASSTYDGTAATKESEYTKMAYCHKNLYEAIKALKAEGTNVSGLTVWGVIEPNSWLHSQSDLGGGASGSAQCPLLFDGNYKAKPAYWAYVDATKLQPAIQKVTITEAKDGNIAGETYTIDQGEVQAEFIPVWDADGLTVQVKVKDTTVNDADAVTVYVDPENSASDIKPHKVTVARTAAAAIAGGYQATVKVSMKGLKVAQQISLDVVVNNDGETGSFNDLTGKQESSSKYYAVATMKPGIEKIPYGTISVDADADAAWGNAVNIPLTINKGSEASANAKVLWDDDNLYVYATVKDAALDKTGAQTHEQDSLEVFIDEDNGKTASYGEDDKQYRINYTNEQSFNGKKCLAENVKSATKTIDGGYVVEAAFKWTDIKPANGTKIGLELQINDAKGGKRIGTLSWYDETGMGWSGSNVYGTVELTGKTGSNGGGSSVNPGTSDTKPDVKPNGKQDTKPDVKPDGKQDTTIETSKVEITVSGDKKAEASVTITKDAQGNVTSANATVSGSKGTLTADVVKQLTEAAGTEDLTIILQVKNANGDVKYTVSVSAKNVKNNKSLKAFVVNRKTGEYELINSKTYKAKDGNLNASFGKKGDYVLLTTKEAARIEKEILKTIAPKKTKATVKKGKTTEFKLDSKLNQNNVKKVTYKTSKKSIATVNKNGKIKANRKGTVKIKAIVTLKNGKTKTVSMKIAVR